MNLKCSKPGHTSEPILCVCINKSCKHRFLCSLCFKKLTEHDHSTKDIIDYMEFVSRSEAAYEKFKQASQKSLVVSEEEGAKLIQMISSYKNEISRIFDEVINVFDDFQKEIEFYAINHWFPQALNELNGSADLEAQSKLLEQIIGHINQDIEIAQPCNHIQKLTKGKETKSLYELVRKKLKSFVSEVKHTTHDDFGDYSQKLNQLTSTSERRKKLADGNESALNQLKANLPSAEIVTRKKFTKASPKKKRDLSVSPNAIKQEKGSGTKKQAQKTVEDNYGGKIKKKLFIDKKDQPAPEPSTLSPGKEASKDKNFASKMEIIILSDKESPKRTEENKSEKIPYNPHVPIPYFSSNAVNLQEKSKNDVQSFRDALHSNDFYWPLTMQKKTSNSSPCFKGK